MRNPIFLFGLLLAGMTSPGILFSAEKESEPTHKGHTLTYWLYENWYGGDEAVDALQAIGTNALPFLIKGIAHPEAPLPGPPDTNWSTAHPTFPLELLTVRAFKALGDQASPLIPELTRLGRDPSPIVADSALNALALMGTNGFPPLFAAIHNRNHPYRARATFLLGSAHFLGSNAQPAVVELVSVLKDTDPDACMAAAHALGELKVGAEIAVPALALSLTSTNVGVRVFSAGSLMWFDERAQGALPALTNLLTDPEFDVRREATNTISSITSALHRSEK